MLRACEAVLRSLCVIVCTAAPLLPPLGSAPTLCSWEPQSRYLATAGADGYLIVWDPDRQTAACVLTRPHAGYPVTALGWSADSKRIVTAGEDGTVRVGAHARAGSAVPPCRVVSTAAR
jgi:WD40 repeat protein